MPRTSVKNLTVSAGRGLSSSKCASWDSKPNTCGYSSVVFGRADFFRIRGVLYQLHRLDAICSFANEFVSGSKMVASWFVAAKTIISCAITGAIHVPAQTPHLPTTPEQIAAQAIAAAEAGAAILHLHARDPETGRPTADPDVFGRFLPQIKAATDAVINITTGGSVTMSLEERAAAATRFRPELCSMNMGSMNFGIFPIAGGVADWKNEWEEPYLESSKGWIFRNTFTDVEELVGRLAPDGTRFEFECYDIGHLYNLAHFLERGIVEPPLFVQSVM